MTSTLLSHLDALKNQLCYDPRAILGWHPEQGGTVRAFLPNAKDVVLVTPEGLQAPSIFRDGLWIFEGVKNTFIPRYQIIWSDGQAQTLIDPYSLPVSIGDLDLYLFGQGKHERLFEMMGCQWLSLEHQWERIEGARFAVWAPNAQAVSLVGDHNGWNALHHPMQSLKGSGIWELFIPDFPENNAYKFQIINQRGEALPAKADPFAYACELRPQTASLASKAQSHLPAPDYQPRMAFDQPMSIYELHLGSWRKREGWAYYRYQDLAQELITYVQEMGFTHIELMPLHEHPFDGSWGYQPVGLYSPTARFGDAQGLAALVEAAHTADIGVIMDWVPGHFPKDAHGLVRFDGTALYEHEDPRQGEHPDWGTLIYNYGRPEVANFLQANAAYWIERFGMDALRVDAVASMLYLDYSREEGQWIANKHGGNENLEAIAFLRHLNTELYRRYPHAAMIAEESTAWPGVTRPPEQEGLGFGYKWNMGWMNDTLRYMAEDPIHRQYHHNLITFGLTYAFSENFILPLSHDEVVHGKGSLLAKMPGDEWQRFANLRTYYGFMWGHPGKKLLFMGQEFAQPHEWSETGPLDWDLLKQPAHKGIQTLIKALNQTHQQVPALYELDCDAKGFEWLEGGDNQQSVLAFIRWDKARQEPVIVVSNFTPISRHYRLGAPREGKWRVLLNSDDSRFGGSGMNGQKEIQTEAIAYHSQSRSFEILLPPLSTMMLY